MRPEHWLFTIPLRLRSLLRWAQADQELDDELGDHLERKTEEYVAHGCKTSRRTFATAYACSTGWQIHRGLTASMPLLRM